METRTQLRPKTLYDAPIRVRAGERARASIWRGWLPEWLAWLVWGWRVKRWQ